MMSDDFDHYYKWLGIPPADQPPNHYRLLGLPDFTEDSEVIANAADARTAHLRTFQLGPRSALSQQVLNEVSRARVCLLVPDTKAAYDAELRGKLTGREQQHFAPQIVISPHANTAVATPEKAQHAVAVMVGAAVDKRPDPSKHTTHDRRPKKKSQPLVELAKIIAGGIAGTVMAYFLVCWISPDNDFLGLRKSNPPKQVVQSSDVISLQPSIEAPPVGSNSPKTASEQNAKPEPTSTLPTTVAVIPPSEPSPAEPPQNPDSQPVAKETDKPAAPIESDEQRLQRLTAERDAALAKVDLDGALEAIEAIAEMTGGDALDQKLAITARILDSAETSIDIQRASEHLLRLLHQAVEANRKDLANRHTDQIIAGARRSSDADLIRWATLCVLKIQKM